MLSGNRALFTIIDDQRLIYCAFNFFCNRKRTFDFFSFLKLTQLFLLPLRMQLYKKLYVEVRAAHALTIRRERSSQHLIFFVVQCHILPPAARS